MNRLESAYFVLFQPSKNNCAAVVSYLAGYFKKNGQYYTRINDLAIGDVVFFQNSKGLSHVGWCVDWSDAKKEFTTIEGNHGVKVSYGVYKYSDVGGYVAGFGKPRYTDEITRKAVLEYAKSQLGYTEGPNNWNIYAEQLDAVDYFEGCGKKQNLPWCAVFICACVYNAFCETSDPEPVNNPETPEPSPEKPEPKPETPAPQNNAPTVYRVKTNGGILRLRAAPNTKSAYLIGIPNGTLLEVSGIVSGEMINGDENWARTTYCGYSGYVSAYWITKT